MAYKPLWLFDIKDNLVEDSSDIIWPITRTGDKGLIPFQRVFIKKMNVIKWLEFELTHYDVAMQHVNHYATSTPLFWIQNC